MRSKDGSFVLSPAFQADFSSLEGANPLYARKAIVRGFIYYTCEPIRFNADGSRQTQEEVVICMDEGVGRDDTFLPLDVDGTTRPGFVAER